MVRTGDHTLVPVSPMAADPKPSSATPQNQTDRSLPLSEVHRVGLAQEFRAIGGDGFVQLLADAVNYRGTTASERTEESLTVAAEGDGVAQRTRYCARLTAAVIDQPIAESRTTNGFEQLRSPVHSRGRKSAVMTPVTEPHTHQGHADLRVHIEHAEYATSTPVKLTPTSVRLLPQRTTAATIIASRVTRKLEVTPTAAELLHFIEVTTPVLASTTIRSSSRVLRFAVAHFEDVQAWCALIPRLAATVPSITLTATICGTFRKVQYDRLVRITPESIRCFNPRSVAESKPRRQASPAETRRDRPTDWSLCIPIDSVVNSANRVESMSQGYATTRRAILDLHRLSDNRWLLHRFSGTRWPRILRDQLLGPLEETLVPPTDELCQELWSKGSIPAEYRYCLVFLSAWKGVDPRLVLFRPHLATGAAVRSHGERPMRTTAYTCSACSKSGNSAKCTASVREAGLPVEASQVQQPTSCLLQLVQGLARFQSVIASRVQNAAALEFQAVVEQPTGFVPSPNTVIEQLFARRIHRAHLCISDFIGDQLYVCGSTLHRFTSHHVVYGVLHDLSSVLSPLGLSTTLVCPRSRAWAAVADLLALDGFIDEARRAVQEREKKMMKRSFLANMLGFGLLGVAAVATGGAAVLAASAASSAASIVSIAARQSVGNSGSVIIPFDVLTRGTSPTTKTPQPSRKPIGCNNAAFPIDVIMISGYTTQDDHVQEYWSVLAAEIQQLAERAAQLEGICAGTLPMLNFFLMASRWRQFHT